MALIDDLVSHWKLNEVSGNRTDSHGSLTLTDNNTVTQAVGKIGDAAQFTAANNEYLSSASSNFNGTNSFTIAGWIYLDSSPESTILAQKGSSSDGYILSFFLFSPRPLLTVRADDFTSASATWNADLSTGQWYFIVAWMDEAANEIGISINDGTPVTAAWVNTLTSSALDFRVGSDDFAPFNGRIDSLSFWQRALTAEEITILYNAGAGLDYPFAAEAAESSPVQRSSILQPGTHFDPPFTVFNAGGSSLL
jgi:hypothetical protein